MKIYEKNNIIINVVEHKGATEETHSHIETTILFEDYGKT